MAFSMGRITARLTEPDEPIPDGLVQQINRNVRPPDPLGPNDVYIRSMYIVSDRVNSFGGRFPEEEHQRLAELLIDSPVMVGHRKDKLPVGRNFHAERTERDGRPWVRSYFYWLRSSKGAGNLAENIDGGVYKECSVAFTFGFPECSICGKDIRLCPHQPLERYTRYGRRVTCHFNYRQIERVLETSLVYRGAVPETSIAKALAEGNKSNHPAENNRIDNVDELDPERGCVVIPRYDALDVIASIKNKRLVFTDQRGTIIGSETGYEFQPSGFKPDRPVRGLLVGYHGRDRCPAKLTASFLEGHQTPVSRLVFNVLPGQGVDTLPNSSQRTGLDVRIIPYREALPVDLNRKALEIMTRDGVEVISYDDDPLTAGRLFYRPLQPKRRPENYYAFELDETTRLARLQMVSPPTNAGRAFILPRFDLSALQAGRPMLAWPVEDTVQKSIIPHTRDSLVSLSNDGGAVKFQTKGRLEGRFVFRPMILNGRRGYLLYKDERGQS